MANHLTPDELAEEDGIEMDAVQIVEFCDREGIPFRNIGGKIDKTLFRAHLESLKALPAQH